MSIKESISGVSENGGRRGDGWAGSCADMETAWTPLL